MTNENGKGVYGTVHVMEEAMREAEQGVFEQSSGEVGRKRKAARAPANKMAQPPLNKSKK